MILISVFMYTSRYHINNHFDELNKCLAPDYDLTFTRCNVFNLVQQLGRFLIIQIMAPYLRVGVHI